MQIRIAQPTDAADIHRLIFELAVYEKAPEQMVATIDQINNSLFSDQSVAFCHVAEVDGKVVGIALWFLNYSTWLGKPGIYLEDLFVQPEYRGHGIGKGFMKTLAQLCIERGYERFQWWVLDWNEPSIEFYKSLGAVAMAEWTVFRLSGGALQKFANEGLQL
jgi:GNAT superfamily N-acetyltransferase